MHGCVICVYSNINSCIVYNWILHFKIVAQCNVSCQNGGTCTSPDVCTCAPGWAGSDCGTGETAEH